MARSCRTPGEELNRNVPGVSQARASHLAPAGFARWGRSAVQRNPSSLLPLWGTRLAFTAYAVLLLIRIEVGLRGTALTRLCSKLGVSLRSQPEFEESLTLAQLAVVRRTAVRTARVVHLWPWGDTCLRRALVIGAMTRDLHPRVVIGVKRSGSGTYLAHAWVEYAGASIDPTSVEFSSFDVDVT